MGKHKHIIIESKHEQSEEESEIYEEIEKICIQEELKSKLQDIKKNMDEINKYSKEQTNNLISSMNEAQQHLKDKGASTEQLGKSLEKLTQDWEQHPWKIKKSLLDQRLTAVEDLRQSVEQKLSKLQKNIQEHINLFYERDLSLLRYSRSFFKDPEGLPEDFDKQVRSLTECVESFKKNKDISNLDINFAENLKNLITLIPLFENEVSEMQTENQKWQNNWYYTHAEQRDVELDSGRKIRIYVDNIRNICTGIKIIKELFEDAKDLQNDKVQLDQALEKASQVSDLKTLETHLQDVNKAYIFPYVKYKYLEWSTTSDAKNKRTKLDKVFGYLKGKDTHSFVSESCEIFCTFHKQELLTYLDPEKGTGNTFESKVAGEFETILSIERAWQDTAKRYPEALQDLPEVVKSLMAVKFVLMKRNKDYCFKIIEGWQEEMKRDNSLTIDRLLTKRETKRGFKLREPIATALTAEKFLQRFADGRHMLDPGGGIDHGSHPHRMQSEFAATAIDEGRIKICYSSIVDLYKAIANKKFYDKPEK